MRIVLLSTVVAVAGCFAGLGPVVAVRMNGDVALGVEGNFGYVFAGVEGGAMLLVHQHAAAGAGSAQSSQERVSGYLAATGTFLWNPRGDETWFSTGIQGQAGIAWGQVGTGLLVGIGPEISAAIASNNCSNSDFYPSFNLRLGIRGFGKIAELYLAPTISAVGVPC